MGANFVASIGRSAKGHMAAAMASARLFYNYLRLSRSYAAGCVHRALGTRNKLNRHGSTVLASVDKYRDVHKTSFHEWVQGPGSARIIIPTLMPEIMTVQALKVGHQSDLFIRFPCGMNGMPQLELLAMIASAVPSAAKFSTARLTPVVQKNLWRDLYLSYLIKNYPEAELWRLGAEAMLVERFIGKVEPTGRRMNSSQNYERRLLVSTVLRHLAWANNISEYAAIDQFPCKGALPSEQQCFAFQAVDLTPHLAAHSLEELLHARQQVILCTGAAGIVSAAPSFKQQGILF